MVLIRPVGRPGRLNLADLLTSSFLQAGVKLMLSRVSWLKPGEAIESHPCCRHVLPSKSQLLSLFHLIIDNLTWALSLTTHSGLTPRLCLIYLYGQTSYSTTLCLSVRRLRRKYSHGLPDS
jgi:hypothetical protein